MVEQLQKTPTDNALREKIIKLAQTVQPAPALPEEALRYEGRARAAFDNKMGATFPNQQTVNLNMNPPVLVTNPFVRAFPLDRDNSAARRFYSEGIYTHNAYEISGDGQIVNAFRRGGTSPAEAREEMARWSCSRK